MIATLLAALLALCAPARALMPAAESKQDARRFGLSRGLERRSTLKSEQAYLALSRFNGRHRGAGPLGALAGPRASARPPRPSQAALTFLAESRDVLGIDPATLVLESETSGAGHHHALFSQIYQGVPVEFARLKVHLDDEGGITDVSSNLPDPAGLSVVPRVSQQAAMAAAAADAGAPSAASAQLVIFPDLYGSQAPRLAWKTTVSAARALWRYYIDAQSGAVLFRYNDLRMACAGVGGTVTGPVYAVDPSVTPNATPQGFAHERVFVASGKTWAETDAGGNYCFPGVGKVSTQLQGDFVSVANSRGASAHFDNGSGSWLTAATPLSTPHPYPNSAVLVSTIDLTSLGGTIFAVAPVFTNFNVGSVSAGGLGESADIADDSIVSVIDPFGNAAGGYVGNKGNFVGAAVPGPTTRLLLQATPTGSNYGYDVVVSSYLTIANPGVECDTVSNPSCNNVQWSTAANTALPLHGEFSLFYHLNLMHDYFASVLGASSSTYLSGSTDAQAFFGPNLLNAFYNPDTDNLFFGDACGAQIPGDCFADDATVPHHEYTHYVVEKIWHIQNFGQAGAISEANADYFSASSFSSPLFGGHSVTGIGAYVESVDGGSGYLPLRQADWQAASGDVCGSAPGRPDVLGVNTWEGEIHCDDRFLLQALWDIRKSAISSVGAVNGPACADGLVMQALLFFPESFDEYEQALLRADSAGSAAACGGSGAMHSAIGTAFAAHGLGANGGAAGFESAVDVSTAPMQTGVIGSPGQTNFYTFAAGAGPVSVSMTLPPSVDGAGFYAGYMMTLFDKNHNVVAQAMPPFDGINTTAGFCNSNDCSTTHKSVVLTYQNPAGGQLFLEVSGGLVFNSNSAVTSNSPYTLQFVYSPVAAFSGSIVTANFDRDLIGFTVNVTTYAHVQDYSFAYAQLRDQGQNILTPTQTASPGSFLTTVSSQNAGGKITGTLQLQPGFSARFPSVGTVYVEVFGYNVSGSTVSLGLSNGVNLTSNSSDAHAWNNVFDPLKGQKATVKYSLQSSGRLTMKLYTLNGNLVGELFDGQAAAGEGSVDWNGRNSANNVVASGIYLLRVQGPGLAKTIKLAVVK